MRVQRAQGVQGVQGVQGQKHSVRCVTRSLQLSARVHNYKLLALSIPTRSQNKRASGNLKWDILYSASILPARVKKSRLLLYAAENIVITRRNVYNLNTVIIR